MIPTTRLGHVGLNVTDVDQVFDWYRDMFGFELFMRFPRPDLPVPLLEESGADILLMRLRELTVELIAVPNHTPHPLRGRDHVEMVSFGGFGHLCFEVDDVFETSALLEEAGVPVELGPTWWPELSMSTAHFHDLEGNDLEILSFRDMSTEVRR